MTKSDSTIIGYITKKDVYSEILKFLFHQENKKYRYFLTKLQKIYSKYIQANLSPQQSVIVNLIFNLISICISEEENAEKRKLLTSIAVDSSGFNSTILEVIEYCKDSSFEDVDNIAKTINDIILFVESIQLISDNYNMFENVLNSDILSYSKLVDTIKKSYSLLSNTIINLVKNDNKDTFFSAVDVVKEIDKLKEDSKNIYSIPTNIKIIDEYKLVTSCRLTIFASPTNHGKTTVMTCIAARCMKSLLRSKNSYDLVKKSKPDKKLVICFITLEESDIDIRKRLLSNILEEKRDNIEKLSTIDAEHRIKQHLKHEESENVLLYVKYMPSGSTVTDIESIIQNLSNKGAEPILVVIDYMDKLTSTLINSDIYRLQLTSVSYELRNISVKYNIPIVTATQLNRESITRARLDLDLISESYGKTWEADSVVVFRQKTEEDVFYLELSIPKSRHTNRLVNPVMLQIDYSKNDIVDNVVKANFSNVSGMSNNSTKSTPLNKASELYVYDLDI